MKNYDILIAIAFLFLFVYVFSNIQRKTRHEISHGSFHQPQNSFVDQLQIPKQQQQNPDMTFHESLI